MELKPFNPSKTSLKHFRQGMRSAKNGKPISKTVLKDKNAVFALRVVGTVLKYVPKEGEK